MINMIKADLFKMFKSRAIKIIFLITTVSSIAMAIIANLITRGTINPGMSGVGFMFSDMNIISIFGAVAAGMFICSDFENKTIHGVITAGISRGKIVVSKSVTMFTVTLVILLPYILIVVVSLLTRANFSMGANSVGLMSIMTVNSGIDITMEIVGKIILSIIAILILYIAQLSVTIPLSMLFKKPIIIVALYYGITILSGALGVLKAQSESFSNVYSLLPFGAELINYHSNIVLSDVYKAAAISLVFILLMIITSVIVFRKTEIK